MATRIARPRSTAQFAASSEPDASGRVLRRFRIVFNAVRTHFKQVEKAAGVGGAQIWALSVVGQRPDIGVVELARAMDIHQATASNLVRLLVQAELLVSVRGELDRRSVRLRLTASGRALLKRAPAPFAGVLPDALARLNPEVLDRLDRDLGTLIEILQADQRGGRKPLAQM